MPRLDEITNANGDAILEKIFADERQMFGDVLNPTKLMAHCPPILQAMKGLYASFHRSALIAPSLHALINARVAAMNGCPF